MNLLDRLNAALHGVITGAGALWHSTLEPWVSNFLTNTLHAEIHAIVPIAEKYVEQAVPLLVDAVQKGDVKAYADAQWDAIVATAKEVGKTAETIGVQSVATAVTTLIAGHPVVSAAKAPPVDPAT